ncbi:DUF7619 domain-containing protein [Winogradskyella schleiferi]|uniref:DUF7619 domain-containing protein n=1 Tax=Winogradskyella schleiferi TaxID=2686078 RepID=UPI0015BD9040|nr:Calx-beta domain-containing protein [Winogradskyella schleiferi]
MKKFTLLLLLAFYSMFCFSQDPTVYITNGGSGYSVIEGNTYTFTVSMYSATTTDVIVDVSTLPISADNSDYTPLSTTVTILAGELSSTPLSIPTFNDSSIEENEYFTIEAEVTSNNTSNETISRNITLWDNDTTPTINSNTTPSIIEGRYSNHYVSISNYFSSDVTINLSTTSGTADASDYDPTSVSLTIPAGELSVYFTINTLQDAITEIDETYTITLNVTSGNTTNTSLDITVTILDNDTTPTLSLYTNTSTTEGYNAFVYARLDRAYNSNVVVELTTTNGTADNSDYTSVTLTKTIASGYTSTSSFQIPTTDDTLDEPNESINITVTVISGNTTNTTETTTVNIVDNDGLPDFYLQAVNDTDNSTGLTLDGLAAEEGYDLKFIPRLTQISPMDTEIEITTTNGSADSSDYTTSTIAVTIPAGQYSNYYEVLGYSTILDQIDEDDENMFVNAQVTSSNTYNTAYTLEGIIIDNYDLNAQPDDVTSIIEVGTTFQVLDNDTFEGLPVDAADLDVSLLGPNTVGISLSSDGLLTIPSSAPMGIYQINYQICQIANPTNCDMARLTIRVDSPLDATHTATYVDFNGDGFISAGDTIAYEFTITNNGNAPIIDIDADYYADFDFVGGPLASLGPGQVDSTTFTATQIITQNNINSGYYGGDLEGAYFYGTYYDVEYQEYLYDQSQSFNLQQSDGIELNAFVDTNGNGTQESSEINFPLGQFNYEVNNDGVINNLYVSPHYLYESNPSTTYELSYTVDADYAANNTTAASYSNVTVPIGSGITTYDFPINVTPYNDLSIDISASWRPPIPGFQYWNYISYTNNSNETVTSGTIDFTMDSALSLLSVHDVTNYWYNYNPASVTITATGFSYAFSNLQPYQTKRLWVKMQVPILPTVSLGQLVTNTVDIELLTDEISPSNNTSSLTQTIVGSYDPNDITEKHGEEILFSSFSTDDYLTYTIRFENTGTANAINIRVEELLNEQLDESTLKMVDASHPYNLERIGKQLKWNFFGVNLPPSEGNDSQVGHGFITFKIKPFPDYAVGDVIPNTAEIYFDFNPAIVTNTWNTTFVQTLGIAESDFSNLTVYPNPVKDILLISNNSEIFTVEISSILGKQILSKSVDALTTEIDLSKFSNGVYFVKIKNTNRERIVKVLKE